MVILNPSTLKRVWSIGPMLPWIRTKRIQKISVTLITACLVTVFLFPLISHAQGVAPVAAQTDTFGLTGFESETVLATTDVRIIVARVVRAALSLLGVIAVGFVLYAGYLIMTSAGNQEKVEAGKKVLTNAVIGIVIIMSSLAIVQFVLNKLRDATGFGGRGSGGAGQTISFNSFAGSGALGRIISDHYPERNQTGVKRNTSIAVTFREGIEPSSLIRDLNGAGGTGNGIFGDCVTPTGQQFNAVTDCDQINTDVIRIYRSDDPANRVAATVSTVAQGVDGQFRTFVFRPLAWLGSDSDNVDYTVELMATILKADRATIALPRGYIWRFQTDTEVDFNPPSVVYAYPQNGGAIPRNHIIQISFSEPIDPTSFSPSLSNVLLNATAQPTGRWEFSNGYKTVEFISDTQCSGGGRNSCGDIMYCLPVTCADPADTACRTGVSALIRTAAVTDQTSNSFQAVSFTGVMDFSNNALDSGPTRDATTGILQPDGELANPHKPAVGNEQTIDAVEQAPDNFWWSFDILNQIDNSAPYIQTLSPSVDAQSVPKNAPVDITFNSLILSQSMENLFIEEFPVLQGVDPIWFVPRFRVVTDTNGTRAQVSLSHREFGPNDTDRYYFPVVSSAVRGINQNCLYPGRGPIDATANQNPTCICQTDINGVVSCNGSCVPDPTVPLSPNTDTGCAQTTLQTQGGTSLLLQPNVTTCLNTLRLPTISPPPT